MEKLKINELKIGNIVIYEDKWHKITSLRIGDRNDYADMQCLTKCAPRDENSLDKIEELQPIPLTKEILLKCGFQIIEKHIEYYVYWIKVPSEPFYTNIQIRYEKDSGSYYLKDINACDINYLHQLQNLYFALTNNELKINL